MLDGTGGVPAAGGTRTDETAQRYRDAVRYLYALTPAAPAGGAGRPVGTARARRLLRLLGDPQEAAPAVHVAGTAGKGSVCTFVAELLRAHGFTVGSHLSPHAYSLRERFRIDGRPASRELLVAELDRVRPAVAALERSGHGRPSFFEVTNAVAFGLFADRVDYSVIETGIGGRHDSTNVIGRRDKLAVLTAIGLDHTEVLGEDLPGIAAQKAGIIAHGGRVVSARNGPEIDEVVAGTAARRRAGLAVVDTAAAVGAAVTERHTTVLRTADGGRLPLGLTGRHQAGNALLALRAVEELACRDGWWIDADAVRQGLARAALPGRFERRSYAGRTIVVDCAHNAMKLAAVAETLAQVDPGRRATWVLALKPDKRLDEAVRAMAPAAGLVVATEFATEGGDHPPVRSRPADEVAAAARAAGLRAVVERDPVVALARACAATAPEVPLVAGGSFHLLSALHDVTEPAAASTG
ncbi:hypothetical protein LWC35_03775 [Pseudonocardia kujensis]|uniref:bifunctional folylpolyglutamate synthase/dihydrofolate synthase n=1 Tax=Pseudonocardia kujensis TaxID=1128675 RepID=UPI001E3381B6|nr:Mur ligase family protein [Pseudonocardia kujensis]MCE0762034.1 hypothetical protein [Pseudonocardia kujensis]